MKSSLARRSGVGTYVISSGHYLIVGGTVRRPIATGGLSGRGQISGFSRSSGVRMARYLRASVAKYTHMVTLTYPVGMALDGRACKEHLRRFIQACRGKNIDGLGEVDRDWSAFWFLEFQKNGNPHFHIFTTGFLDYRWVSATWERIVDPQLEFGGRIRRAGTRCELLKGGRSGAASYARKYAAKQEQKEVPAGFVNVGRFWGIWGCRAVMEATTWIPAEISQKEDIKASKRRLYAFIQKEVAAGRARILSERPGSMLVLMLDKSTQGRSLMKVAQLGSVVNGYTCGVTNWMFEDAEIVE